MLHTKFREYRPAGSGEDFRRVFISLPVQSQVELLYSLWRLRSRSR